MASGRRFVSIGVSRFFNVEQGKSNFFLIAAAAGVFFVMSGNKMRISQAGIDRIKQHEGWSAVVYKDQAGKATIGWGHLIKPGEVFGTINKAQGEAILRNDLSIAESAVNRLVEVPLSQSQYDALVSFVFNVGVSAFENSTLLQKLNAGDVAGAGAEFSRWRFVTTDGSKVESAGLLSRRLTEQALFNA